ncbi:gamma-glutamyl-gamma-aminobutyrate hydrolase family protein [Brachybacterium sp. AOP25-B2-12]|uniref:gamma-glutamyl-gamma-aminobutyrate hydrolase family protein n=1 Tax=Brachybacterium sp. AOP25-B2-12 TaxID=3457710 RepID=UPI0040344307
MASNGSDVLAPARPTVAARPVIGVTTYLERATSGVWDTRAAFLQHVYLDAVLEAGGIPVLLPPQPCADDQARTVLGRLDGLVIAGGADVDPALYGQRAHPRTGAPRTDRDAWEEALLRVALDDGTPVLGICRGAQVLDVALGGGLVQHLPDVVGDDRYQPSPGRFGTVDVAIVPGSRLARILGPGPVAVPVHHHQAIGGLGAGLHVTGRCADGTVQAVELDDHPFCLAVQWHPEEQTEDRRLLAALVDAARAGARTTASRPPGTPSAAGTTSPGVTIPAAGTTSPGGETPAARTPSTEDPGPHPGREEPA